MDETKLNTLEEKMDVIIDLLLDLHGHDFPDTKFRLVEFADGTGRFIPASDMNSKEMIGNE